MAHKHPVYDTDAHFKINHITRAITTQDDLKTIMQGDHNSERFSFEIPNVIDGHDMKLCNKVLIHYMNGTNEGPYEVNDIEELDQKTLVFTWLISGNSTEFAGALTFLIEFLCLSEENEIVYAWHTDIFTQLNIKPGMNNTEHAAKTYPDLLEQWKEEIFSQLPEVDVSVDREEVEEIVLDVLTESEVLTLAGADDETVYTDSDDIPFIMEEVNKGAQGPKGDPGQNGKTPVKGTDYFTEADKQKFVNDVIAALPTWTGGTY